MNTEMLREAPLFSGLDDEAAEALSASMNETKVRRGDVLFHEGDEGDRLYVVTDGKVKLGRTSADGRENLLAILGPGQARRRRPGRRPRRWPCEAGRPAGAAAPSPPRAGR